MNTFQLFQAALGIQAPWYIKDVQFSNQGGTKELHIILDFEKGSTFTCINCTSEGSKPYDTEERTWRHLNFFEHKTYLTARVPRVSCGHCGKTRAVNVPWAAKGSDFTLLFEAYVMALVREMPVNAIARLVNEHDVFVN